MVNPIKSAVQDYVVSEWHWFRATRWKKEKRLKKDKEDLYEKIRDTSIQQNY